MSSIDVIIMFLFLKEGIYTMQRLNKLTSNERAGRLLLFGEKKIQTGL